MNSKLYISEKTNKLKSANLLFRKGDYSHALKLYREILKENPNISKHINLNIKLCEKKVSLSGSTSTQKSHYLFKEGGYQKGEGYSVDNAAIYFDSALPKGFNKLITIQDGRAKVNGTQLKIVFIADTDPKCNPERKIWGAENSAEYMVEYGRQLGHHVIEVTPSSWNIEVIKAADLLVLRSLERLADDKFCQLKTLLFEGLKRYVTYQHDYAFCKFRNSIRCNGIVNKETCHDCLKSSNRFFDGQLAFYTELLARASMNIFISHPQRHIYGEVMGSAIDPSIVILPPVDPKKFQPIDVHRDPDLIINTSGKLNSKNKGFSNIVDYIEKNNHLKYELYTEGNGEILEFIKDRENVKIISPVDFNVLPYIYSRATSLVVMPSKMEPAGRTPVEAALCGCNVIMNHNLGVSYFNLPLTDRDLLVKLINLSLTTLWQRLYSIAGQDKLSA